MVEDRKFWVLCAVSSVRNRLPLAVIVLGLTSLFTDIGTEMIFPLLPAFILTLGGGAAFLGVVEGVADATSSLLKLGTGLYADRLPRKKPLVVAGYALASLVRPFVALATRPWHVLVVRVSDRVGKGVRSSPRDLLIAAAAPAGEAGRAFGVHQAMDHAGAMIGPLVATLLLAQGWSLRAVFWAAAVPGILATLCVMSVREPAPAGADSAAAPLRQPTSTEQESVGAPPVERLSPRLKSYLWILLLFALGNSSDAFLLLRAHELGVRTALLPLLWTAFHVVKFGSAYYGGRYSDRVPRARLIIAGWVVYAFTYLGFGMARAPLHAWLCFLLYGFYFGLTEPVEKALLKDIAPTAARGKAYGYYNFIIGISAIPASLLTGMLWQRFGASAALSVGAALAASASVLIALWSRRNWTVVSD